MSYKDFVFILTYSAFSCQQSSYVTSLLGWANNMANFPLSCAWWFTFFPAVSVQSLVFCIHDFSSFRYTVWCITCLMVLTKCGRVLILFSSSSFEILLVLLIILQIYYCYLGFRSTLKSEWNHRKLKKSERVQNSTVLETVKYLFVQFIATFD